MSTLEDRNKAPKTDISNVRRLTKDKREYTDDTKQSAPFYRKSDNENTSIGRNTGISDDYQEVLEERANRAKQPKQKTSFSELEFIRNQQRLVANNNRKTSRPRLKKYLSRSRSPAVKKALKAKSSLKKGKKTLSAVAATGYIVTWTIWPYLIQLLFAFLSIIGLGIVIGGEETWTLWLLDIASFGNMSDAGEIFTFVGMFMTLAITILCILFGMVIYTFRGVSVWKGNSLLALALCIACSFVPFFSLAPWTWFWCLAVVKSQID